MATNQMKIDKRFVFPLAVLRDYVKSNWKNSSTQYEILAALTVSKAFEDEKPGEYFIYFPLLASHEKRFPMDKDIFFIEDFFNLFHDPNSAEDIYLLRKEDDHFAVTPLQIKRFGTGKWAKNGSLENLVSFLQEKGRFTENDMQLIIPLEDILVGPETVKYLEDAGEWLKVNKFPFKGVIALHPFPTGEMMFWQLKPTIGKPAAKIFLKEQIIN